MNNTVPTSPTNESVLGWRIVVIPLATILFGIGISVAMFLLRDKVDSLGNYGYLGAFLISMITSATIFLPVPGIVVLFALAHSLNPLLVAMVGATGAIIGEMTGFLVGFGGHKVIHGRNRFIDMAEQWMKRKGTWAVFAVAAVPLPLFDVAGMIAGALRFPLWKFMLIGWVGKCIKFILLVYAGVWGWDRILGIFQ